MGLVRGAVRFAGQPPGRGKWPSVARDPWPPGWDRSPSACVLRGAGVGRDPQMWQVWPQSPQDSWDLSLLGPDGSLRTPGPTLPSLCDSSPFLLSKDAGGLSDSALDCGDQNQIPVAGSGGIGLGSRPEEPRADREQAAGPGRRGLS